MIVMSPTANAASADNSFNPGDRVSVGDQRDINGVIEEVVWRRGMISPLYLIEWWDRGMVMSRLINAADVTLVQAIEQK